MLRLRERLDNMNGRRKKRLLEKLAARTTIYTHLGGRRIKSPVQATEAINSFLKTKPGATIAEVVDRFLPGGKPSIKGQVLAPK